MRQATPKLSNIHILIADGDLYLSSMLAHALHAFGFTHVTRVATAKQAADVLRDSSVDLLLTEWGLPLEEGYSLVQYVRDPKRSPNLTLPMIMISGRAERENVEQARDLGVTEFVVKPFTSAMLFDRIRRLFDQPRDFVISKSFVGPDRRHQRDTLTQPNLRLLEPLVVSHLTTGIEAGGRPVLISKNHDLKNKANIKGKLEDIITPQLLKQVQQIIFSYQNQSSSWIAEDITQLERAMNRLAAGLQGALDEMKEATLSIKSRAGMFDHAMAANIAFALYGFLQHDYDASVLSHVVIIKKHVQVIKVMLAGGALGHGEELQQQLAAELLRMTAKLKNSQGPSDELLEMLNAGATKA